MRFIQSLYLPLEWLATTICYFSLFGILWYYTCIYNVIGHRCNVKGCGTILILDGNQKNNRTVCAAEEAGYVEYHGLPGMVKTGCMNTPIQTSTFCALHKPREMKTENESTVRALSRGTQHRVIESILQEKQTRNGKYYQVSNCYYHPCRYKHHYIIVGEGSHTLVFDHDAHAHTLLTWTSGTVAR